MATPVGTPTEASNPSGSSVTWSHTTPTGTDRMLVVSVGIWDNTPGITTVASVTYNGVAMARVTGLTSPSHADGGRADMWFLLAPDEGAHDVVVTLNATQEVFFAGAQSFDDVDPTTPFGTPATATGTGVTISVNVSSAAGELVYDTVKAFRTSASALTPGADQTEVIDIGGGGDILAASHEAGAATVTMSWTYTNGTGSTRAWAIAAVPIKAPAAGTEFTQGTADTAGLTEAVTRQAQRTLPESLGLTEAFTRESRRAILETISLTEQLVKAVTRPVSETVGLTEDLQAIKLVVQQVADTVTLTENLGRVIGKAAELAEAVGLAEQLAKQTNRSLADTLGLTENLAAIKVAQQDVADVLALSETVSRLTTRALAEQVSLTEAQQREVRKTITELAAFTEQLVVEVLHQQALGETVTLTEAQQRAVGRALQETLGLTETRIVTLARGVTETVLLEEVLSALLIQAGTSDVVISFGAEGYRMPEVGAEAYQMPEMQAETFSEAA